MPTLVVRNLLDSETADAKDRVGRQVREQIVSAATAAGDRDVVCDIIQGVIFISSDVPTAVDSLKALFAGVQEVDVEEVGTLAAMGLKSRLLGEAKRARRDSSVKSQQ